VRCAGYGALRSRCRRHLEDARTGRPPALLDGRCSLSRAPWAQRGCRVRSILGPPPDSAARAAHGTKPPPLYEALIARVNPGAARGDPAKFSPPPLARDSVRSLRDVPPRDGDARAPAATAAKHSAPAAEPAGRSGAPRGVDKTCFITPHRRPGPWPPPDGVGVIPRRPCPAATAVDVPLIDMCTGWMRECVPYDAIPPVCMRDEPGPSRASRMP
jgi:hypothetical protein